MDSLALILHHVMQMLLLHRIAHGGLCAIIILFDSLGWGYILYRPGYRWCRTTGPTVKPDIPSELDRSYCGSGLGRYGQYTSELERALFISIISFGRANGKPIARILEVFAVCIIQR